MTHATSHTAAVVLRRLNALPVDVVQFAMRVAVASVFFKAGLLKWQSFEFAVKLFEEEYRVPLLDPALGARVAMLQELGMPVLLVLGLGTRLATLPLLGAIAVIQLFVYPLAWTDHLLWASILIFLLLRGPGRLSLDALIIRRWGATDVAPASSGDPRPFLR